MEVKNAHASISQFSLRQKKRKNGLTVKELLRLP